MGRVSCISVRVAYSLEDCYLVYKVITKCMTFLSSDAGGVGLNLQNTDCVINFELPWNPAKLNQRIGRVHRIGQKSSSINVINLIAKNSIEERVYAGIHLKQELFDTTVEGAGDSARRRRRWISRPRSTPMRMISRKMQQKKTRPVRQTKQAIKAGREKVARSRWTHLRATTHILPTSRWKRYSIKA